MSGARLLQLPRRMPNRCKAVGASKRGVHLPDCECGSIPRLYGGQSVCGTGEAPPERRTIHFIFADPILVAMECVPVASSSDLKQDVSSCVRSVKIQKLYETFVVSHQ